MPKIARLWFGKTLSSRADEYEPYIVKTGVKDLQSTPGNEGVLILRRDDQETTEFGVISFWESLAAIEGFAGKDIGKAVYYPEDHQFLLKLEPRLVHFQIALAADIKR
jgi:hypothetical protein